MARRQTWLALAALAVTAAMVFSGCGSTTTQSPSSSESSTTTSDSTSAGGPPPTSAATTNSQPAYPPTDAAGLHALAATGDASAVHEFHSEGVGLATCPQPKREVTVDTSLTGRRLAADLLAYFYAQGLDNPCGSLVLAYHDPSEAGNAYTGGRINLNVTDSSGAPNGDPNASGLMHQIEVDTTGADAQTINVTY